jgi:4-hydroxy-tetrahydrodipicolinate synthase
MLALGAAGEVAEARRHAEALLPLITALFAEPSPAVVKALLHAEGRIATPDVRMPLTPASREALSRAQEAMRAITIA